MHNTAYHSLKQQTVQRRNRNFEKEQTYLDLSFFMKVRFSTQLPDDVGLSQFQELLKAAGQDCTNGINEQEAMRNF